MRAGRERRNADRREDLVGAQRRREHVDEEIVQGDGALAGRRCRHDLGAQRHQHRGRILRRIGVRKVAAERRLVADAHCSHRREGSRERGAVARDLG